MTPSGVSVDDCRALLSKRMPQPCPPGACVELAEKLASLMPTGPNTDKANWIADMTVVFSSYAETDVRTAVLHPLKGLRARHKWLPDLPDVIAFLDGLRARRGRILANARRVVTAHDDRVRDEAISPISLNRMLNLSRSIRGLCSIEQAEQRRVTQSRINAYATQRGDGDMAKGFEIMVTEGLEAPPENWTMGDTA